MSKTDGVVIDNIGPIEHLELDAKPGTITVLRGMNGEGKSTALDAIAAITRGTEKLESRDGTTGGTASGFGMTIKVGRGGSNRRTGELLVTAVEDRLSIADFVDPGLKDQSAADARRLKALVTLAGVEADPTLFYGLVGGAEQFKELVKPDSLKSTDPISMAEAIKRDFESASRLQTTRAERLFGEKKAKVASNDGLDLTAEQDAGVLQRRLEMWLAEVAAVKRTAELAETDRLKRVEAQKELDRVTVGGKSLQQASQEASIANDRASAAMKEEDKCEEAVKEAERVLWNAKEALKAAQRERESRSNEFRSANEIVERIRRQDATLEAWRQTLANPTIEAPSLRMIEANQQAVDKARSDYERGVLIRDAIKRVSEAEEIERQRKAACDRADYLRDAARGVFDTLSESVKGLVPGIKLDGELRIIVPHPKRGQCYYSDLSHGERWKMAIDIAVNTFHRKGQPGVLAIPQEAWEGLDGKNRQILAQHVSTTDLVVFTAEAERSIDKSTGIEVEILAGGAK